jgi:hypothetical protein
MSNNFEKQNLSRPLSHSSLLKRKSIRERLINKLENSEFDSVQSRFAELKEKINLRESQRRVDYANQLYEHYQKHPNPEVQKYLFKEIEGVILHSLSQYGNEPRQKMVAEKIYNGCEFNCYLWKG